MMSQRDSNQTYAKRVIHGIDRQLDDLQRRELTRWAERMLEIRDSPAPDLTKAREALTVTYRAEVLLPLLRRVGANLSRFVWRDRSFQMRVGMIAAGLAALTLGGEGAGIAMLGTAIGVPLWVVFGAGGLFVGQLLSELRRPISGPAGLDSEVLPHPDTDLILEAEWAVADEPRSLPPSAPALPPATSEGRDGASDPLSHFFRRAYRAARARQHTGDDGSVEDPPPPSE
jgi:hypothetical protein